MIFRKIIAEIPDLAHCFKPELDALGCNVSYIRIHAPPKASGSIDIDACLQKMRPNETRWDYVFAVADKRNEKIFYVEIHEKSYDEIERVKNKYLWLIDWLYKNGGELTNMISESEFYWLGRGQLDSHIQEIKVLAEMGLEVRPSLDIHF